MVGGDVSCRRVTELAIANSDLIQLSYDPGKVSTACGQVGRRLRPFGA